MKTNTVSRATLIRASLAGKYNNPRRTAGERLEGRERLLKALDDYVDADKRVTQLLVDISPSLAVAPEEAA